MAYRCLLAASLMGADAVRRGHPGSQGATFFGGVPVFNYHPKSEASLSAADAPQEWIVVLDSEASDSQIAALCKSAVGGSCEMTGHPSEGGVPFVAVQGSPEEIGTMFEKASGLAKYVEPNFHLNMIPDDDAAFGESLAQDADVGTSSTAWHIRNIGRASATHTGKGVNVYVFDTGIRVSHRDFTGRAVPTLDVVASPSNPRECNGDTTCAGDRRGHGTHCGGLVGGVTHGTAPEATIHAVKVLDDGGAGPWSNIIGGLDWVAAKRLRPAVASLSLGGPGTEHSVSAAVDVAVGRGVTVVVASGNFNSDACDYTPAFSPGAFTVGAIATGNQVASFSNYGRCTNIWAPGFNIESLSHTSDTALTKKSGTSMAAPLVSGGAAVVLEANPDFTAAKVRAALEASGIRDSIKPYSYAGGMKDGTGDINLRLFVGDPNAPPAPPPSTSRRPWFR